MSFMPALPRIIAVVFAVLAVASAGCSSGSSNASSTVLPTTPVTPLPTPDQPDPTETNANNTPTPTPDSTQNGIIIDHRSVYLDQIPAEWIIAAKEKLHIAYGHTSHGSQLITGMSGLMDWKGDLYAWNGEGGKEGTLDLNDYAFSEDSHDLGSNGNLRWEKLTRAYLDDPGNSDVNVVIWSWCGGVSDNTSEAIDIYLNNINQLEQDYPDVVFVYMTGHSDGTGLKGNLHIRNQQIRDYCVQNSKVLYDFYDIECYDPDGNYFGDKMVNDNCDYDSDGNGSRDANWAQQWQNSHTKGVDWYACGAAHSQSLNANQKAYAAWWLWARIAGWGGSPETVADDIS